MGVDRVALAVDPPFAVTASVSGARLILRVEYTPTSTGAHAASLVVSGVAVQRIALAGRALSPLDWDPEPPARPCRADGAAPLLDAALAATGLDRARFGFGDRDLASSRYFAGGLLDDEFVLSWFRAARGAPHRAGCLEGALAGPLDRFLDTPHPIAGMIRHLARTLDRAPDAAPPFDPRALPGDFHAALDALCEDACGAAEGALPPDLAEALAPILWAMREGIAARRARDAFAAPQNPEWWTRHGGNGAVVSTSREAFDRTNPGDRAYLLGEDRARLYRAAAQIAFAVEHAALSRFAGARDPSFAIRTPSGWIRVHDAAVHTYRPSAEATLLLLDLGGDDVYLDEVATNRNAANAVSVVIDLAGDDRYAYAEQPTPQDRAGLVPADDGRRYGGDDNYGPISLSARRRQGAARNGIAMLFDLAGDDHYQSLVASQGYAHQGVGVLFDGAGNDTYLAEANAQGSAQFGIALAVDAGEGWDTRRAFTQSQGFGFVGGAGALVDGGGDDVYVCDHGDPAQGGIRLYPSPQLPADGNTSMCQGAGFGWRGDGDQVVSFMSGGLGVLRDRDGNDRYEGSVFAQGAGYWQSTGLLSDGGGSDLYDAYWYVQGAAAHYAIGVLADAGPGQDAYNTTRPARNVSLGAGHDFSIGVLIDDEGPSEYHISPLSAGASHCNGVGLFVDNGGDDLYVSSTDYSSGMGNVGGECASARPDAVSIGVMIDAGGRDTYRYPPSRYAVPTDTSTWGHTRRDLPSEHGAGLDAEGESGVHPEAR